MTEPLSPAAAAVMIAATNGNFNVVDDPVYKQCIAAALEAAANQSENLYDPHEGKVSVVRVETLLAIAAELRAQ